MRTALHDCPCCTCDDDHDPAPTVNRSAPCYPLVAAVMKATARPRPARPTQGVPA